MASAMDGQQDVLNLTRQHLKKVEPAPAHHYSALLLDHNDIPRLENVETYCSLTKLSASHNQLMRMYGVARLYSLRVLNLSHNAIVSIEGLKDMKYLSSLNLAGNNIKTIEHLNSNALLEHLDLSDNAISTIPDLSHMKGLKKLHLSSNRIKMLLFCEKFLPPTLTSLTLADNALTDLNEVSRLGHLALLEVFSLAGNPCTSGETEKSGAPTDYYRPFVVNWLPGLKILDDELVNAKESLAAEWLYSLGRGRQFKPGQHDEVVAYLASVRSEVGATSCTAGQCNGSAVAAEEVSKLDKILTLVQQHQTAAVAATTSSNTASPSPQRRSTSTTRKNPIPLRKSPPKDSALVAKGKTSTNVAKTAVGNEDYDLSLEPMPALMCQSLDPSAAHVALERGSNVPSGRLPRPVSSHQPVEADDSELGVPGAANLRRTASAAAVRKPLYPRPDSAKALPKVQRSSSSRLPVTKKPAAANSAAAPSPLSSSSAKLSESQAAVTIQKVWRGYQTRNLNPAVRQVKTQMRLSRTEDHVVDLSRQLAQTRELFQAQQARAQAAADQGDLRETCARLQREVRELQTSMQQVLDWIVSAQPVPRPRTLQLANKSAPSIQQPVETFAQGMAERLIKSVAPSEQQPIAHI